jgi:hypothetical protein
MVELVGMPGAGKSYLCSGVAAAAGERGIDSLETTPPVDDQAMAKVRIGKIGRAVGFALLHPLISARLGKIIVSSGQQSFSGLATKGINLLSELKRFGGAGRGMRLSDQGVVQAVWSIGFRAKKPVAKTLLTVVERWLPATLVMVEVDRGSNIEQLASRVNGHSLFDRLPPAELKEAMERGAAFLSEIVGYWSELVPAGQLVRFPEDCGAEPGKLLDLLVGG